MVTKISQNFKHAKTPKRFVEPKRSMGWRWRTSILGSHVSPVPARLPRRKCALLVCWDCPFRKRQCGFPLKKGAATTAKLARGFP